MKLQIIGLGILEVDELKPCRFCGGFVGKNIYVVENGLDMYPTHFRCIPQGSWSLRMHSNISNKYAGQLCTLDDLPAKIIGRSLIFGKIAPLNGGVAVEFAWSTIDRIMQYFNGSFKS